MQEFERENPDKEKTLKIGREITKHRTITVRPKPSIFSFRLQLRRFRSFESFGEGPIWGSLLQRTGHSWLASKIGRKLVCENR